MPVKAKHPSGPPMDLANMRRQGVRTLIAYCLNDACRHQALIEVWSYPPKRKSRTSRTASYVQSAGRGEIRLMCGRTGKAPGSIDDWSGRPAIPGEISDVDRAVPTND